MLKVFHATNFGYFVAPTIFLDDDNKDFKNVTVLCQNVMASQLIAIITFVGLVGLEKMLIQKSILQDVVVGILPADSKRQVEAGFGNKNR